MTNKEVERRINNAYMDGRADALEEIETILQEQHDDLVEDGDTGSYAYSMCMYLLRRIKRMKEE